MNGDILSIYTITELIQYNFISKINNTYNQNVSYLFIACLLLFNFILLIFI